MKTKNKILFVVAVCTALIFCSCSNETDIIDASAPIIQDAQHDISLYLECQRDEAVFGESSCGSYVSLTAETNDEPSVSFLLTKKINGQKLTKEEVPQENTIVMQLPSFPCVTDAEIIASYEDGTKHTYHFSITTIQETGKPFEENGSHLSAEYVCFGSSEITVTADFSGGVRPYRYSYSFITPDNKTRDEETAEFSAQKTYHLDTISGKYLFKIMAQDARGQTAEALLPLSAVSTLPVSNICQNTEPKLPTGCEVSALTACLNYYGFHVNKNLIAEKYLPVGDFYYQNGRLTGPDPLYIFAGTPMTDEAYGCYEECIVTAANRYFKDKNAPFTAKAISVSSLDELDCYLRNGHPVLIWATMYMWQTYPTKSWVTEEGKKIEWLCNEHCFVLAGINHTSGTVTVADPLRPGSALSEFDAALFMQRFLEQGSHAAIIERNR